MTRTRKPAPLSYSARAVLESFLRGLQYVGCCSSGHWHDPAAAPDAGDAARFPYGASVAGPNLDGLERRGFIVYTWERNPPLQSWCTWHRAERVYRLVPERRAEALAAAGMPEDCPCGSPRDRSGTAPPWLRCTNPACPEAGR